MYKEINRMESDQWHNPMSLVDQVKRFGEVFA